jgi:hypothetical protein
MDIGSSDMQSRVVCIGHGKYKCHCVGGKPAAVSHSQNFRVGEFFEQGLKQ